MAEVLGLAASVIAVIDLFVKIGVLCSSYCAGVKKAPRDIRYILNEADRFTATLKDVEKILSGPNGAKFDASQNVQRGVADCQRQLGELAIKLEEGMKYKKITWPLKKEEVTDVVKNLERSRGAISLDLQINQTAILFDVQHELVLAKLRTAEGATFDSHADPNNARCLPGTRIDILQKIQAWAAAQDSECVFWLSGAAGTGKSTISRTVAQSFADQGTLGASFFFKRGEGDRGHTALFFTTIVAQLVRQLPSLAPHVRSAIEADPIIHEKSLKDQFDKLIANPIQKLPTSENLPLTLVIVDALDECGTVKWQIRSIIHFLSQAKHFTSIRLKFFVTSRPELPIRLGFTDISGKYENLILHQVPVPVIERDITAFLKDELDKIQRDYNRSVTPARRLPSDWPGVKTVRKLVEMAIPLFIVATTFCRFIQDRRVGGPNDQLARILNHQGSGTSNLDATYLPVLDRLLAGLSKSERCRVVNRFKQVVGSIVILVSPLPVYSLARLLIVSTESIEDQLDELHSVLSVPSDPNVPVRLLHLSFRDFLVDPENSREQDKYPFCIDEQETHERLATQCLQLLLAGDTLKRDICGLRLPGAYRSEIDQQTINTALPPEVQYSCRYWVYHWKESKRRIKDGDLVDRFLTRHFLHWLEALGLLGQIREGSRMIDDLLSVLQPEESNNVAKFLRDAQRVILSHRSIIDVSPLQVYYSAIMFAPEQSVVRKTFRDEFPAWLSIPQVDSSWDMCLQTFEANSPHENMLTFSHDSTVLASASYNIKLWDISTGTCTATLQHSDCVRAMAFSHESVRLASVSQDSILYLWDIATCNRIAKYEVDGTCPFAFSHDSTLLASSKQCAIMLSNTATGNCTATLEEHRRRVIAMAFSHESRLLASLSVDGAIKLWDIPTGECIMTLEGIRDDVPIVSIWEPNYSIAFSHDSLSLAVSRNIVIDIWNIVTGNITAILKGHEKRIRSLTFFHNSTLLASAASDHVIRLWNIATGDCILTLNGHGVSVNSVSTRLASASSDRTIKLWDIAIDNYIPEKDNGTIEFKAVSHNLTLLALTTNGFLQIWDVKIGSCIMTIKEYQDIDEIIFSPDSTQLVILRPTSQTIEFYDITTGENIRTISNNPAASSHDLRLSIHKGSRSFALSHDSTQFVTASGPEVSLWNIATLKCTSIFKGHTSQVHFLTFSHNSILLASLSYDQTQSIGTRSTTIIKIWNVAKGDCTLTLRENDWFSPDLLVFSRDLTKLISAGDHIYLWDLATGARIQAIDPKYSISPAYLAFDATVPSICTGEGTLALIDTSPQVHVTSTLLSLPTPTATAAALRTTPDPLSLSVEYRGIGFSEDDRWVTWNSHRVLWLPPAYRRLNSAVIGLTAALECQLGRLIFVIFSPSQGLTTLYPESDQRDTGSL